MSTMGLFVVKILMPTAASEGRALRGLLTASRLADVPEARLYLRPTAFLNSGEDGAIVVTGGRLLL